LRIDETYTARGQLASVTRYSNLTGTQVVGSTLYGYDSDMRVTLIQDLGPTGTPLATYAYGYDLANRLRTEADNGGPIITYVYDATNQLLGNGSQAYSFDQNGNRTNSGYNTPAGNQLQTDGVWNFSYDNEGNLTKAVRIADNLTWSYAYGYDSDNHMTSAMERQTDGGTLLLQATYVYDAFGQRIEKDVWTAATGTVTTRFAYLQGSGGGGQGSEAIWADLSSSNALQTRYLRGDDVDQLFARVSASGTAAWYLTGQLGSIRNLTDNSGNLQDTILYDPFGVILSESNAGFGDRYKYTAGRASVQRISERQLCGRGPTLWPGPGQFDRAVH
jgi:hypothetical protein